MSCTQAKSVLRFQAQDSSLTPRYQLLPDSIIIPIFCACMISAMGSFPGTKHAITMQFDVDANTEYISRFNVEYFNEQQLNIEENLTN